MQFACAKCEKPVSLVETAGMPVPPEIRCESCGASWPNKWWVVIRGDKRGPMTLAELVVIVEKREVEARTFVWTTGFGPWIRAGQLEAFKSLWAGLPPEPAKRPITSQSTRPVVPASAAQVVPQPVLTPAPVAAPQPVSGPGAGAVVEAAPAQPASAPVAANPPTGSGLRPRLHLRSIPPPPLPTTGASPRPAVSADVPAASMLPGPFAVLEAAPAAPHPVVVASGSVVSEAEVGPAFIAATALPASPVPELPATNIFGEPASPAAETLLIRADDLAPRDVLAEPAAPSAPPSSAVNVAIHADGHHEDLFFAGGATAGAGASTAGRGAQGPAADLIDLKHVLDDLKNASGRHIAPIGTSPTGFSMVTRLHRPDKKRWFVVGGVVAALAAAVVIVVAMQPPADPAPKARAPLVASSTNRTVDPTPPKPPERAPREEVKTAVAPKAELTLTAKTEGAVANGAGASNVAALASGAKVTKPKGLTEAPKNGNGAANDGTSHGLTKEQFAVLTEDDVGKQEVKLEFDPGAAARKAADEAAAKQRVAASNLAQDVASAFGKKKTQFARCSDGSQERVRLVFTVQPTGKVANTHVEGTTNNGKAQCLTEILGRAIFPASSEPATYSQVMVL